MIERNVIFIGEVRQTDQWIAMDWGYTFEDVKQKVRRRIKRLIGPIRNPGPSDMWYGRVSQFSRTNSGVEI